MDGPADTIDMWEQLVRYHRSTLHEMDESLRAEFGRTLDEYDVLHQVDANGGPIRMGELSARLLVANSSCTRIVGRLAGDGYLSRHRGTADRREVLVDMTEAGRRLHRRMGSQHARDIERLFEARLTPVGRAGMIAALADLRPSDGT